MRQYKIYENAEGETQVVKEGWSWPAFLFGAFWALWKKMWILGFGVLAAFFAVDLVAELAGEEVYVALDLLSRVGGLILWIVFGLSGNEWYVRSLERRGFLYRDTLSATDSLKATEIYASQDESLRLGASA